MEVGLLIIRVVLGALFIGHGTQKLFGWFNGPGLTGTGQWFESLGFRKGKVYAAIGGAAETLGGLGLLLGLLTPLAAAAIIGVMVAAIGAVHARNGLWVDQGGFEYPLTNIAVATGLAFAGPGTLALDAALGWTFAGVDWGLAALVLGVVVGLVVLGTRALGRQEAPARA